MTNMMLGKLANSLMFLGSVLSAASCVGFGDGADDLALGETDQAIGQAMAIGDFNGDGWSDSFDALNYVRSYGIKIATYAVTDDVYHRGENLHRSAGEWSAKSYGPECTDMTPFPVHALPGMNTMANNLARLPQQYLRELGARGFTLIVSGDLGRFHKRWDINFNGTRAEVVFFREGTLTKGRARFGKNAFKLGAPWEELYVLSYQPNDGSVKFKRVSTSEWFKGEVSSASDGVSIGSTLSGHWDGDFSRGFYGTPVYGDHGTTSEDGFNSTASGICGEDAGHIGRTGPAIVVGVAGLSSATLVHEIGHAIHGWVLEMGLNFWYSDVTQQQVFEGHPELVDSPASLVGTGHVSHYSANNSFEDFAETWMYYTPTLHEDLRGQLMVRISQDNEVGDSRLQRKRDFVFAKIDRPDPGPAVAVHPATNQLHRVMTRRAVVHQAGGVTSSVGYSAVTPALVSNGVDKLWLFATSLDNVVWQRSIAADNSFGPWSSTGVVTKQPPTAVRVGSNAIALFTIDHDERINYRLINASTGSFMTAGLINGLRTRQPISVTASGGKVYLAGLDLPQNAKLVTLTYYPQSLAFSPPVITDLGKVGRFISIAAARIGGAPEAVYVMIVDQRFRIQYRTLTDATWRAEPSQAYVPRCRR
jgi:hypothetical protein